MPYSFIEKSFTESSTKKTRKYTLAVVDLFWYLDLGFKHANLRIHVCMIPSMHHQVSHVLLLYTGFAPHNANFACLIHTFPSIFSYRDNTFVSIVQNVCYKICLMIPLFLYPNLRDNHFLFRNSNFSCFDIKQFNNISNQ